METKSEFINYYDEFFGNNQSWSEQSKKMTLVNFWARQHKKMNVMITGATGCGKSSTINALFDEEIADVGVGTDPETMEITRYEKNNLILWDTPGLGDGKEADIRHSKKMIQKLNEVDERGNFLIDFVLVILDGSSRDLGTTYNLINNVIAPNLRSKRRILIGINQADMAMKGQHWNYKKNMPDEILKAFLDNKEQSVRQRIQEGTGWDVTTVCYAAGYKVPGEKQCEAYNISGLLYHIIKLIPESKRKAQQTAGNRTVQTSSQEEYEVPVSYSGGILEDVFDAAVGFGGAIFELCYITTAICEEFGKPDDCYELTTLRNFRDHWLKYQPGGEELIQRYYDTAPEIVAAINRRADRRQIYQNLRDTYLAKCLEQIRLNENEKCKETYIAMVEDLSKKKLEWEQEEKSQQAR